MHFDVPKVVRSPGCDHGHDEESRNGRDINIDILEAYVWTSEVFRVKSTFYWSTGRLPEPPPPSRGGYWAYMGPKGEEEGRPGQAARPLPPSPNRTRKGVAPPFPLSPFPLPFPTRQEGGVLLLVEVGLLQAHP